MKTTFKIGDKVKITKSEVNWAKEMSDYIDKIATLTHVDSVGFCKIDLDEGKWVWKYSQGHFISVDDVKPEIDPRILAIGTKVYIADNSEYKYQGHFETGKKKKGEIYNYTSTDLSYNYDEFIYRVRWECGDTNSYKPKDLEPISLEKSAFTYKKPEFNCKFKIGDNIVGNKSANQYTITGAGWIGKVIEILSDDIIIASPINSDEKFTVDANCFNLFTQMIDYSDIKPYKPMWIDGSHKPMRIYDLIDDCTFPSTKLEVKSSKVKLMPLIPVKRRIII